MPNTCPDLRWRRWSVQVRRVGWRVLRTAKSRSSVRPCLPWRVLPWAGIPWDGNSIASGRLINGRVRLVCGDGRHEEGESCDEWTPAPIPLDVVEFHVLTYILQAL